MSPTLMTITAGWVQHILLQALRDGDLQTIAELAPEMTVGELNGLRTGAARLTGDTTEGIELEWR